jgi:NADH-quinone oxidoreductase subunit N
MAQNLLVVLPELTLVAMAVVVLLIDVYSEVEESATQTAGLSLVGVLVAMAVCLFLWDRKLSGFSGTVKLDAYGLFLSLLCLGSAAAAILLSADTPRHLGLIHGEYFVLLLLSTAGMMVMVKGTDLITIFLGLETLSIPLYVLAGYRKQDPASTEASLKYFLMGAVASGFLLYGIALTYAALGTTQLDGIREALFRTEAKSHGLLLAAVALMLVGFGFKMAVVPFHMWAPDVYEGAPTPVTAFMAAGVKVAAVGSLMRVLGDSLFSLQQAWATALWILAIFSILFGNILALTQENLKRMLAYSSIAHVGYILLGLLAFQRGAVAFASWSVLFYLASYVVMTVGAFGVLLLVQPRPGGAESVSDLAGLDRSHPLVAVSMAVFLLSLTGIPPLWGFVAKFYVFGTALQRDFYWLVLVAVIGSLISVFYYLRVIVAMFMAPADTAPPPLSESLALRAVVGLAAILTVLGGLFPTWLADHARTAFANLLGL